MWILVLLGKQLWPHRFLEKVFRDSQGPGAGRGGGTLRTAVLDELTQFSQEWTSFSDNALEFPPFLSFLPGLRSLQSLPSAYIMLSSIHNPPLTSHPPPALAPFLTFPWQQHSPKEGLHFVCSRRRGKRRRAVPTYEWEVKSTPSH